MRITKWGEYGILCSLYLAHVWKETAQESGAAVCVSAVDIGEKQKIPTQYAQQILHRLKKGGVIDTVRGPKGGYRLTKAPKDLTLKDVLLAAEGDTFEVFCDNGAPYVECSTLESCGLKGVWVELKEKIDAVLDSKDLATLLENHTFVWQNGQGEALVEISGLLSDADSATNGNAPKSDAQ